MNTSEFQIDGRSLRERQDRCQSIVREIEGLPTERLSCCPVCESSDFLVLAETDRYGLPFQSALCLECGHIFQVDRFGREGFAIFYRDYYRDLVSAFKGKPDNDLNRLQKKQRVYGESLLARTRSHLQEAEVGTILDVGGSSGVVASIFCDHYQAKGTILDPAPDELRLADRRFEAIESTVEEWEVDQARFDLILLCNTIEHLRDFRLAFEKMRRALAPGGILVLDVADYAMAASQEGPPECISKVDHCHWLTLSTSRAIFSLLGFECRGAFMGRLPEQVGFVLSAADAPGIERIVKRHSSWPNTSSTSEASGSPTRAIPPRQTYRES